VTAAISAHCQEFGAAGHAEAAAAAAGGGR
jgi:hypothetical protein